MGTTVATNALLERKGEPTRAGHHRAASATPCASASRAGRDLFARHIVLPAPLYDRVVEIDERVARRRRGADGRSTRTGRAPDLQAAFDDGFRAVAIVLMHGWRFTDARGAAGRDRARDRLHPDLGQPRGRRPDQAGRARRHHRGRRLSVAGAARAMSTGSARDLGAGDAAAVHAVERRPDRRRDAFRGKDAILSGPAGGVVGMAATARAAGLRPRHRLRHGRHLDRRVATTPARYERTNETRGRGRAAARADAGHPHGGGGRRLDLPLRRGAAAGRARSRPGAVPGPACYRRGGPLTVTDCNVMLGKLRPDVLPAVFGPNGDQPLDADVVARSSPRLPPRSRAATGGDRAARRWPRASSPSPSRTWPRRSSRSRSSAATTSAGYVLACFGGAGGQHACLVADALGMTRVMLHPLAGVLSAYGMGLADLRAIREATRRGAAGRRAGAAIWTARRRRLEAAARAGARRPGRAAVGAVDGRCAAPGEVRRHRHRRSTVAARRRRRRWRPPSRRRTAAASASSRRSKALVVEALSVEAVGAPPGGDGARAPRPAGAPRRPLPRVAGAHGRQRPRRAGLSPRRPRPGRRRRRPRPHPRGHRHHRGRARLARARSTTRCNLILDAHRAAAARRAAGHATPTRSCWRCSTAASWRVAEQMGAALRAHGAIR